MILKLFFMIAGAVLDAYDWLAVMICFYYYCFANNLGHVFPCRHLLSSVIMVRGL